MAPNKDATNPVIAEVEKVPYIRKKSAAEPFVR